MRQNSSIQFHVLTATWVGSGCLPRLYCQWSGREFQELRGKGVKARLRNGGFKVDASS